MAKMKNLYNKGMRPYALEIKKNTSKINNNQSNSNN